MDAILSYINGIIDQNMIAIYWMGMKVTRVERAITDEYIMMHFEFHDPVPFRWQSEVFDTVIRNRD